MMSVINTMPRLQTMLLRYALVRHLMLLLAVSVTLYGLVRIAPLYLSLTAGVRAGCLMLLPRRYWATVLLAESICYGAAYYDCLPVFGWPWFIARMVPPDLIPLPLLLWVRPRLPAFPRVGVVDLRALFFKALIISVGAAVSACLLLSLSKTLSVPVRATDLLAYAINNYLGMLAVLPWVLMFWLGYQRGQWWAPLRALFSHRLWLDLLALLLPGTALLIWLSQKVSAELRPLTELAGLLPLAWLALRHGWRPAAAGGAIAVVVLCYTLPMDHTATVNSYGLGLFLSLSVTSLLALGGRVSAQQLRERREQEQVAEAQRLHQQNLQLSEQRMRQMSHSLEYLAGKLHVTHARLLEQISLTLPQIEAHPDYRQALAAQDQVLRLAENLHPVGWRERGLPTALKESIGRVLQEAGIDYHCRVGGRGYVRLNPALQTAAYRVACEAVVLVSARLDCRQVRMHVHSGQRDGQRWLALRVEGIRGDGSLASAIYLNQARQELSTKLGAHMLGEAQLREQAQMFQGELRVRSTAHGQRVSALLLDPNSDTAPHAAGRRRQRLWVE